MKAFTIPGAIEIIERTPLVLQQLLSGLSDSWIYTNEGDKTWSPFDILSHLLDGDKMAWTPRIKLVMENDPKAFAPFDTFTQTKNSSSKSCAQLLTEFQELRSKNIATLKELNISEQDLQKTAVHPDFGEVTLKQFLAAWVVHDLGHIRQMVRVMAKRYGNETGPWGKYLRIVHE